MWATHVCNTLVINSSACFTLVYRSPWSCSIFQDMSHFSESCSLKYGPLAFRSQGRSYILYVSTRTTSSQIKEMHETMNCSFTSKNLPQILKITYLPPPYSHILFQRERCLSTDQWRQHSHLTQQSGIAEEGMSSFPTLLSVMLHVVLWNQQQDRKIHPQKPKQLSSASIIKNTKWKQRHKSKCP